MNGKLRARCQLRLVAGPDKDIAVDAVTAQTVVMKERE